MENNNKAPFNPNEHITKLPRQAKNKETNRFETVYDEYLEVKWRMVWFRDMFPNGTIETEEICVDLDREVEVEASRWNNDKKAKEAYTKKAKGYARYKATVTNGVGGKATGTKSESAVDFGDYIEKAETGAIGRALAALGFGTQFTGDELNEKQRIVDSPIKGDEDNQHQQSRPQPQQDVKPVQTDASTCTITSSVVGEREPVSIAVPTTKTLYETGGKKGMWKSSQEFYSSISHMLTMPVGKDTKLTQEQRIDLAKQIEAQNVA